MNRLVPKSFGFSSFWGNSGPLSGQKLIYFAHCIRMCSEFITSGVGESHPQRLSKLQWFSGPKVVAAQSILTYNSSGIAESLGPDHLTQSVRTDQSGQRTNPVPNVVNNKCTKSRLLYRTRAATVFLLINQTGAYIPKQNKNKTRGQIGSMTGPLSTNWLVSIWGASPDHARGEVIILDLLYVQFYSINNYVFKSLHDRLSARTLNGV